MQDTLKWVSENKDVVQAFTGLFAVIIGFVSILLTFLTLRANRKHNRLSVKPIADVSASDFEDKLLLTLTNKGSGPLIIKRFQAVNDGTAKNNVIDWMPALPPNLAWSNFVKNIEGCALRPSESIPLIDFSLDPRLPEQRKARDSIRQALSILTVEVEYSDIYDNPFKLPPQSLSWFARNLDSTSQTKKER